MISVEYIAGRKKNTNSLFNNKIFIFLLSLIIAIVVWCVISMYETPETERVFPNVKVQMSLTDTVPGSLEMSVFGNNEFYCDVTVSGKSYVVTDSTFTSDKIRVRPDLDAVREPGVYEVRLSAQMTNATGDVSVVSVEPAYVTVYFDKTIQKSYMISSEIDPDYLVAHDCTVEKMEMSKDYIIVSGPSLEMNKLKEVKAHITFVDTLQKSVHQPCAFEFITSDGLPLTYSSVITPQEDIYLDVQISKEKTYEMIIDVVNVPTGLHIDELIQYTINDFSFRNNMITLHVPTEDESLMAAERISVGQIDFADLQFVSQQTVEMEGYKRDIFTDVLPETLSVTVYLDTDAYTEVSADVTLQLENAPANVSVPATVAGVSFIMRSEFAESFRAENVYAVVDGTDFEELEAGTHEYAAVVMLGDYEEEVMVRGDYSIFVTVTDESASATEPTSTEQDSEVTDEE